MSKRFRTNPRSMLEARQIIQRLEFDANSGGGGSVGGGDGNFMFWAQRIDLYVKRPSEEEGGWPPTNIPSNWLFTSELPAFRTTGPYTHLDLWIINLEEQHPTLWGGTQGTWYVQGTEFGWKGWIEGQADNNPVPGADDYQDRPNPAAETPFGRGAVLYKMIAGRNVPVPIGTSVVDLIPGQSNLEPEGSWIIDSGQHEYWNTWSGDLAGFPINTPSGDTVNIHADFHAVGDQLIAADANNYRFAFWFIGRYVEHPEQLWQRRDIPYG